MTFVNIVALTITAVYLMLGGIIYVHSRRQISENLFGLLSLCLTAWGLATFLTVSTSQSAIFFKIGAHAHYLAGNLIFLSFFWFSIYFPERTKRSLILPLLMTLIDSAILVAIIFSNFLFTSFIIDPINQKHIVFNNTGYALYASCTLFFFVAGTIILFKKYKTQLDANKLSILYVFVGSIAASVPALISNLILPYFGQFALFAVGPIFGIFFVVCIGYAVFKHNLLNVKIVATEFFVSLIILILAIEVLSAGSVLEFIVKTITLTAVSILSYLIIRSVLKEVQTREQIEQLAGELQKANEELARINQAKSDFISMASHQLKTPLSIIKGYISMTLEGSFGKITKMMHEQLEKVFISNERLISLVEDLLNLSRVEEGRMKYDWSEENISDIVQQIVDETRMMVANKHLKLVWKPPLAKLYARVDLNKMRNVIFNMVDNAIKYTEKGTITITVAQLNALVRVSVADTGRGISAPQIQKLFTKFTRVIEGASNLTTTGFGLGLYVARLIVNEHKGRIWAESAGLGKGSTFSVEVPLSDKKPEPAENIVKPAKNAMVERQTK